MAVVVCPYCGSRYETRRIPPAGRLYSCKQRECIRARKSEYQKQWERKYKETHGVWSARRFNENSERKRSRDRKRNAEIPVRKRYPAQFAAKDARRQARKTIGTVEIFDRADVFERDGWVCQLCGEPVDRNLKYPDLGSKSLDHILPLSKGGEHSRANTQLTHLGCNIRKGARTEVSDGYSWASS